MASFGLKVIRLALSSVAAVSPAAAGRAAFRLFATTPGRRSRTAKERELFARSEGWMRQAQRVELSFAGGTAVAHRFAARPCEAFAGRVLVVHGWGSQAAYLSALTEGLVAAGHEVVALDLPGHGASRGRTLTLPMAVRAIDAAWQRFGGFDYFCGHSFGGASLACAASGLVPYVPAHRPRRLVTIGSPSEMSWLFKDLGRYLKLGAKAQVALEDHVERIAGAPLSAFDAANGAGRLNTPMLVIHAEDDKEVPAMHARRYAAAGSNVTLEWANGFGHRRIVSAEPVIDRIVDFFSEDGRRIAA
ncbi:alpha/beta fold hydrolase [Sinorhizobium sp. RAC02]|uniref:alpha/beta hydrolase n=1 Tax=Sinorhizobium sp. RAC02 TaxID=1842534 RepID=UPI00083CF245|nr:alpha/beta fold hydrolase [Sinorhizobium sp. RAC02]AOF91614.1 alpha/beta hydrolase family protein [Sinorhizobium sp. RAC02]